LIGVIGLVAVLAVIVGLILPKAAQIRTRQKDVVAAQAQERTLSLRVQLLKSYKEEAPKDRKTLAVLERQVPETTELGNIIVILNDTADTSAVDFMTVTPGAPTLGTTSAASTITTQITVTGEYFSVDEFLHRLERLSRAAKVTQVTMTPTEDASGASTLTVSLTAEFYTTDLSAGPGSIPGHTGQAAIAPPAAPVADPTPPTGG
jgi:Tfp pilus assembly protein PilO